MLPLGFVGLLAMLLIFWLFGVPLWVLLVGAVVVALCGGIGLTR